jgi:hypothetical protein
MLNQLVLGCAGFMLFGLVFSTAAADSDVLIRKAFIMTEAEDGRLIRDSFEVWDTFCVLRSSSPAGSARCSITAISLAEFGGQTHAFTWRHDSQSVSEIQPGIFRIEMNGRLSLCSGLRVIMRVDKDSRVEHIEGDMRGGTQCQSIHTYSLDTTTPTRPLSPLWNAAYRLR